MRMIDADRLFKVIAEQETWNVPDFVYESINNAPTVDIDTITERHEEIGYDKGFRDGYAQATSEVRHGHWVFGQTMGHSWMKCSKCCVSQNGQTATFTYCPNCGAKMDEMEDG